MIEAWDRAGIATHVENGNSGSNPNKRPPAKVKNKEFLRL
jgi:hypothetical protein